MKKIFVILLCNLALFLRVSSVSAAELYTTSLYSDGNLQHYYRMEGNSNDSKGSVNGSDTSISYNSSYGKFGQGANFTGSSKIQLGEDYFFSSTYSISLWFYPTSTATYQNIYDFRYYDTNGTVAYLDYGTWLTLMFRTYNPIVRTPSAINQNEWNHLVFEYLGGDKENMSNYKIYINNVSQGITDTIDNAGGSSPYNWIGADNGGPANQLIGNIDDFAVFDRVLSSPEINTLYSDPVTPTLTPTPTITLTPTPTGDIYSNFHAGSSPYVWHTFSTSPLENITDWSHFYNALYPDNKSADCIEENGLYCHDMALTVFAFPRLADYGITYSQIQKIVLRSRTKVNSVNPGTVGFQITPCLLLPFWSIGATPCSDWPHYLTTYTQAFYPLTTDYTFHDTEFAWSAPDFPEYAFNSSRIGFSITTTSANQGTDSFIDALYLGFKLNSPPGTARQPTFSLDSSTASPSAGLAYLNMSGDFATSGANLKCKVSLMSICNKTGYAEDKSNSSVATISFDAKSPSSSTIDLGNGYYTGISNLTTNGIWSADNVAVPYKQGWTCTYPSSYQCVNQECSTYFINGIPHTTCGETTIVTEEQGVVSSSPHFEPNFIATPSATNDTPDIFEGDCGSDWICSFKNWLLQQAFKLFVPHVDLNTQFISLYKTQLNQKAPFAYVIPIFSMDLTNPSTTSAIPSFTFAFPGTLFNSGSDISYTWTDSGVVSTVVTGFRTTINVLIWACFIVYLFYLGRRIL